MQFTRDALNSHSDNLNMIADQAVSDFKEFCEKELAEIDWNSDSSSRTEFRNRVIDYVNYLQDTYGTASESLGSQFFDNAMTEDGEIVPTKMVGKANQKQVSNSVRYWAKNLFGDEPNPDAFVDGVSRFVKRTITHAADLAVSESAASNNRRKGIGIVYARVPQGPTCAFCILLASRGFVYASEESAGKFNKFHDDCNCRIVAGLPGTEVEGYHPDEMYDRYNECRKALTHGINGADDPLWKDWNKLTPDEQAAYADEKGVDAYNNYVMRRIVSEMRTRDRQWLYDGTPPEYEIEIGAKPSNKEIDTANRIAEHGFKSRFRPTRDLEMKKTSDVFLVSGNSKNEVLTECDFKCVTGNGTQTIYHQFEEAAGQAKSIVIDLKDAGSRYEDKNYAIERTEKFIKYHYPIKAGFNAGENWVFNEAMILFKDGSMVKIAR